MNRRALFAACAAAPLGLTAAATAAENAEKLDGPLAHATVSFGAWMTPLDRFPNFSPIPANHHELLPGEVTIRAGGSVSFIISGFHLILIYGDGKQAADVNTTMLIPPTNQPVPPLINDPNRRIYRGLDPSTVPQDRAENVTFHEPGVYLVACGVLPHFREGMFGWVRVIR
jgi:plastocyanin